MNIYKYICMAAAILLATAASASEKPKDEARVRFTYDVGFEMNFDNREFSRSEFSRSMTIFGARLTPSVGLSIPQKSLSMNHKLMFGIDIMKNFGASPISPGLAGDEGEDSKRQSNLDLFREITLYYNLNKTFSNSTGLELYAGIFPRRNMSENYSEAFFSDSLKFYDNNIEGLLLKITRPKSNYEVGIDWIGQKGMARKEKFMIFSAGESSITPWFKVGYAGYMYHFAGSQKARGVVDNILLNPFVKFDIGCKMNFQEFSFRLGWLQAMQHDRVAVGHYVFPRGGEFDLTIMKWNVGIHNKMFYGTDMMPYYNSADTAGDKYGSRLYFGDPFYRIHDTAASPGADTFPGSAAGSTPGLYNRLDIFYEPHIGEYLAVRISARFHFHGSRYTGTQQLLSLLFNLNSLVGK